MTFQLVVSFAVFTLLFTQVLGRTLVFLFEDEPWLSVEFGDAMHVGSLAIFVLATAWSLISFFYGALVP